MDTKLTYISVLGKLRRGSLFNTALCNPNGPRGLLCSSSSYISKMSVPGQSSCLRKVVGRGHCRSPR